MLQIQAEIRFADILELMKSKTVKHFTCHHVAFMLHDKLMGVEGFAKYHENFVNTEMGWVPETQSQTDAEFEIRSADYYFVDRTIRGVLDSQVVAHLNEWILKIVGEDDEMYFAKTYITDYQWTKISPQRQFERGIEYATRVRIELMEKIVNLDPDAVMSINL